MALAVGRATPLNRLFLILVFPYDELETAAGEEAGGRWARLFVWLVPDSGEIRGLCLCQ